MERSAADSAESLGLHHCGDGPRPVRVSIGDECLQCGLCLDQCPVRAIVVSRGRYGPGGACLGCASCVEVCPVGAVRLVSDDGR